MRPDLPPSAHVVVDESMHRSGSPRVADILTPMNLKIGIAHYMTDE
jgi:hypothetical protein